MNIDVFENKLCRLYEDIEKCARECCSEKNGQDTWCYICKAASNVRDAINNLYKMR